mgnify:CR=1 FL=1
MDLLERFKKYISFDTTSDENSLTIPSSKKEIEFGKILVNDLYEIGLKNAYQDEYGYVYGYLDLNKDKTIGLIAHMDTAPSFIGGCTDPLLVKNYNGSNITLKSGDVLTKKEFPILNDLIGDDLLFTDGYHLLGGDDKAGIVIIFEFIKYLLSNKNSSNYNISICFTIDEEIGRGPDKFDIKKMNADIAYTLDGESIYEANYENFNAASATIDFYGVNVHPGNAKDIMVNSILAAISFNNLLPNNMIPSKTSDYEGFIHLEEFKGDVNKTTLKYILRDHDEQLLENKKEMLIKAKEQVLEEYKGLKINLIVKDDYKNMGPYFIKHREALELINKAYLNSKIKIKYTPIRGGTDGATITYMGLPCPNLGVGDFSPHGKFEFVSISQMKKMVEILKNLAKN